MALWEMIGYGLLGWACFDITKGRTYLVGPISRTEQPVLFWLVALAWTGLGIYLIIRY